MIIPLNSHVLIEPIVADSFIASQKETYEEIGIVLALPIQHGSGSIPAYEGMKVGDKVYFDSFRCAKYPNGPDKFYWLVEFENIRAYEKVSTE